MAQVIRKYQEGGTTPTKPVTIEIAGTLYNVQDIKDAALRNLDTYLLTNQLNDESKQVIQNYYNYLFPAMQQKQISYSNVRPRSFVVAPEWDSDGTFNETGHGILRRSVTNDKKAGINFGTDLIYELIDKGVIKPYKAPEKKDISLRSALDEKIRDKYFGGNAKAYTEGWKIASVDQRKDMLKGALLELDFDPEIFKGVDTFNIKRTSFLEALNGELNDDLALKFNNLGGYGLKDFLGYGNTSSTTSDTKEETKAKTEDDYREQFRQQGISEGILSENLEDYVNSKMQELKQSQAVYKQQIEAQKQYTDLENAYNGLVAYKDQKKGEWYKTYGKNPYLNINVPESSVSNSDALYDFSSKTNKELQSDLTALRGRVGVGMLSDLDPNPSKWVASLINECVSRKALKGNGQWKAITGSENGKDLTVLAFDGRRLRVMSMFDFPEVYGQKLSAKFIREYNQKNGVNLPDDFYSQYEQLVARLRNTAQQVEQNKEGGILKAKTGEQLYYMQHPEKRAQVDSQKKEAPSKEEVSKKGRELQLKDYQVSQLMGFVGDIAATVGAFTGGGLNPLTHAGNAGSLIGHTYSDLADPNVSGSEVAENLLINSGLAAISYIPGLGGFLNKEGRMITLVRGLRRAAPWMISAFAAANVAPEAIDAVKRIQKPGEKVTYDDLKAIGYGITAMLGLTRAGRVNRNAKAGAYENRRSKSRLNRWGQKKETTQQETASQEVTPQQTGQTNVGEQQTGGTKNPGETSSNENKPLGSDSKKPNTETGGNESNLKDKTNNDSIIGTDIAGTFKKYNLITKPKKRFKQRIREARQDARIAFSTVSRGNTSTQLLGADANARIRAAEQAIKNKKGFIVTDRDKKVRIVSKLKPGMTEVSPEATVYIKWPDNSTIKTTLGDALLSGYSIKFNKQGGFIDNVLTKYLQGGLIPKFQNSGKAYRNVTPNNKNSWYDQIFMAYFPEMLKQLDAIKDPTKLDEWINQSNQYQTTHSGLFKDYDPTKALNYNKDVETYQTGINTNREYINQYGVTNGWKNNRYSRATAGNQGDGVKGNDGNYVYTPDGLGGTQTYDRRIFGKKEDFTDETLANTNKELNKRGVELYAGENGYMYMRRIQNPATQNSTTQNNTTQPTKIKINGVDTDVTPVLDENGKPVLDSNGRPLYQTPDGTQYTQDGIATGSNNHKKSWVRKVLDKASDISKNINIADVIALNRMIGGINANNEATEVLNKEIPALIDPFRETAIVHGDYLSKVVAQNQAGALNAIASKPISSDAGTEGARKLEAAIKGSDAIMKGQLADSEMYYKTSENANLVANRNAERENAISNTNLERLAAIYNKKLENEAARITANEMQVRQPYWMGVEQRYRNAQAFRQQAQVKAAEEQLKIKYNSKLKELQRQLASIESESWKQAKEAGTSYQDWSSEFYASPEYQSKVDEIDALEGQFSSEYYSQILPYLEHYEFKKPTLATPGIVPDYKKKGGSLSYAERMSLKQADHFYKTAREAQRSTNRSIQEDKKAHRKQLSEVSKLTSDLLRKAVGIIK